VFVLAPGVVATASMVKVCVPPPLASEATFQVTVPFVPTEGADAGAGLALTYVKPEGSGSLTTMPVTVVCELFVTVMLKRTVSPRLTRFTGVPGAETSAALLVTVSTAVRTGTPVVSLPVRVPTLVTTLAVLKNVPPDVPALQVKMNVRELEAGSVTAGENVHVIVPDVPLDEDGVPSVPPVLVPLVYVNPAGRVSTTDETVTAVAEVLPRVRV